MTNALMAVAAIVSASLFICPWLGNKLNDLIGEFSSKRIRGAALFVSGIFTVLVCGAVWSFVIAAIALLASFPAIIQLIALAVLWVLNRINPSTAAWLERRLTKVQPPLQA